MVFVFNSSTGTRSQKSSSIYCLYMGSFTKDSDFSELD